MKVALYHRVSTLDQNPTLARDELRGAALRMGGAVVLDVEETGSGARSDRPGLTQVMDAARRGKVDTVVVWKLDRFGRSVLDVVGLVRELEARGVRFVAVTQGIDTGVGGAAGRFMLSILAAAAEFERDLIKERTRLGLDGARKKGVTLGRRAVLSPAAQEQAREWRGAGASWRSIAARLANAGAVAKDKRGRWPSHASVARACTKTDPEIDTPKPGKKTRSRAVSETGRFRT